ncbi:MAG: glycosyltransferase, partial [Candidatus Binatia bacterium]
ERIPSVRCRHLGDGPVRERLAARHHSTVDYLGASSAVEDFLRGLDVFVLTSDREGCPNVLLEAMASALAIVATNAGGVAEVVRDGVSGFVVPVGAADALTERTGSLLADFTLRQRMGAAARAEAEGRFSVTRMVDETVRLYRAVAGGAPSKAAA